MDTIESTNINSLWLKNIYENLKNLEIQFRYAFEGCKDVLEYCNIPLSVRPSMIADTQYKNMRFIVTELRLLIKDIAPVIPNEYESFLNKLKPLSDIINNRKLFIYEPYSEVTGRTTQSKVTLFYEKTLRYLNELNLELVLKIKHLLYIQEEDYLKKPWEN